MTTDTKFAVKQATSLFSCVLYVVFQNFDSMFKAQILKTGLYCTLYRRVKLFLLWI